MSLFILLIYLSLVGNGFSAEEYDSDKYGPEELIVWDHPAKATFVHKIHTMDAGLACDSCHDELFEMEAGAMADNSNFTMAAMAAGQFCGKCHNGDTAFASNSNCKSCHVVEDEPIVWSEPTMVMFSHNSHVEDSGLECADCHNGRFMMKKGAALANKDFTMASFKKGLYCGSCHNGDDAFDSAAQCGSCHLAPKGKIIFNQPVKSVVFEHVVHVEKAKLSCESCHKEVFAMKRGGFEKQKLITSENAAEKRKYLVALHKKYCGTCHDSSQAFGYLTRCTVCHVGVKGMAGQLDEVTKNKKHDQSGSHLNSSHQ